MDAMQKLIERLQHTTAADRELDAEIGQASGQIELRAFTSSVDAALELIPHSFWLNIETAGTTSPNGREWPVVRFGCGKLEQKAQAKTLPLTLCIAGLLARNAGTSP